MFVLEIIIFVAVAGFFVAAMIWGEDTRDGFTDPRRRDRGLADRRSEFR